MRVCACLCVYACELGRGVQHIRVKTTAVWCTRSRRRVKHRRTVTVWVRPRIRFKAVFVPVVPLFGRRWNNYPSQSFRALTGQLCASACMGVPVCLLVRAYGCACGRPWVRCADVRPVGDVCPVFRPLLYIIAYSDSIKVGGQVFSFPQNLGQDISFSAYPPP